jgi:hypothetical protein
MILFFQSLSQGNSGEVDPPPSDTTPPDQITDLALLDIGEAPLNVPVPALPTATPVYRDLTGNEVRLLLLVGHSDMNGQASVSYRADGNYADPSELVPNGTMMLDNNTGTFVELNYDGAGSHGRELQIKNRYKEFFDAVHTQPLHFSKRTTFGMGADEFVLGSPFFREYWKNNVVGPINLLLSQGKTPMIHVLVDFLTDTYVHPPPPAENFFNWKYLMYSFKYLFNKQQFNFGLSGVNPAFMPYGFEFQDYFEKLEAENTPYVHFVSKEGLIGQGGAPGDIHAGHFDFDSIAQQHLEGLDIQPLIAQTTPLTDVDDSLVIYFRDIGNQLDTIELKMDVPFTAIVFTTAPIHHVDNVTQMDVDVRLYRNGYISILNDLTGITRFEAPYIGICFNLELIEKHKATLNYIDLRGSNFNATRIPWTTDTVLSLLVAGGVTNGTLKLADSAALTNAAQTDYLTLVSRGWTIDVPSPIPVGPTQLATPGSMAATPVSQTQNNITWSDVSNEVSYLLEVSNNGTTGWSTLATPAAGATSYNHTGLTASTLRYYRLSAIGNGTTYTTSAYATANATTLAAGDVTAPTVVSATATDANTIVVVFSEAVNATNVGWAFKQDGATIIPDSISGSGTNTLTFTFSETLIDSNTLLRTYDSATGNTMDASANELVSFTDQAVTNDVPPVGGTEDADITAWVSEEGATNAPLIAALHTFATGLKADDLWDDAQAMWISMEQKVRPNDVQIITKNLKNPSIFNLTLNAGWTHTANGSGPTVPGGAFGFTNYVPLTHAEAYNQSVGYYAQTNIAETAPTIGAEAQVLWIRYTDDIGYGAFDNLGTYAAPAITDSRGFSLATKGAINLNQFYKEGLLVATDPTSNAANLSPSELRLNGATGSSLISNHKWSFVWIGRHLDATKNLALRNHIHQLHVTMGIAAT